METMIINQQSTINYTKDMQKVILDVVNASAKMMRLAENTEISIMIVDNSYIQELNFIYRQQNRPTDVLSFAMNELSDDEPEYDSSEQLNILGDIVLSLEQASLQSSEYGHSLERELGYLVAHGMLHLMSYDHETDDEARVMRSLEEKIMQAVKLER